MEPFGLRGNDPDAKLLALVTQWDTCPAVPTRPPPIKNPQRATHYRLCLQLLCYALVTLSATAY